MWALPKPGLEPVSPALAGRFSTTAPPGKPITVYIDRGYIDILINDKSLTIIFALSSQLSKNIVEKLKDKNIIKN